MTISTAFAALSAVVAQTLTTSQFIPGETGLFIDDPDAVAPAGDETDFLTWAALTRGNTTTVRHILGRPEKRYVVEHRTTLELAWAGPDQIAGKAILAEALAAVAGLPNTLPTLSGNVERFFIEEGSDEQLPPNGWATTLILAFRIRSGDPLGLTP